MFSVFDDPDPLMLDQEDYEAAEFAENRDSENDSHFDWDSVLRDQDDYEAAEYAEKSDGGGGGGGSGSCGNCIMYALGAAAVVIVLGHLFSACS